MNQIMAIKLYFGAECVVLQPDRNEDVQRGTTWLLFSLAAWAAWSPLASLPYMAENHCSQQNWKASHSMELTTLVYFSTHLHLYLSS